MLERAAHAVMGEKGIKIDYKFGTMIEIPRAALTADQIAGVAQFFSYGTNDLTQMTFGYSRDDAESKFLLEYVDMGILPKNPFQSLDRDGVGKLVAMGVKLGRQTRPDLEVGICGEHGGDPSSVEPCYTAGLNYVSCSPFRVPIAGWRPRMPQSSGQNLRLFRFLNRWVNSHRRGPMAVSLFVFKVTIWRNSSVNSVVM